MMKMTSALIGLLLSVTATSPGEAADFTCMGSRATMTGTPGPDHFKATDRRDVIVSRGGDDVIEGLRERDRVCAGKGNDRVTGFDGIVSGGGGDDQARASRADLFGGAGDDVLRAVYGNVYGGLGSDRLLAGSRVEGGSGDDRVISSSDCPAYLVPGGGDDYVVGGHGPCLDGPPLRSILDFTTSPNGVRVDLGQGTSTGWGRDTIRNVAVVFGSPFDDVLKGDASADSFEGQGGDDVLLGGGGRDRLDGDDSYPKEVIERGPAGSDLVLGGPGEDRIFGREGDDRLRSGADRDVVAPGDGSDALAGGSGEDIVRFSDGLEEERGVTVNLAEGTASGHGTDTLSGFETVEATSADDVLIGDESATLFLPEKGNDEVYGAGGDDVIIDLTLGFSVAGDDLYDGGEGLDTVSWDAFGGSGPIEADMSTGTATGHGDDSISQIEGLIGSSGDDILSGDASDNHLGGESGDDQLDGRGGSDTLDGGDGTDVCLNGENRMDCP